MNFKYNILAGLTFLSTTTQTLNGQNIAHEYSALSSHFCNLIDPKYPYSSDAASNAYEYAYKALKYSTSQNDSNNAYEAIGRVTSLTCNPERQTPEIKQAISNLSHARTESDSTKAYRELGIVYAQNREQIKNKRHTTLDVYFVIAMSLAGAYIIYFVGLAILRKNKNARKQIVSFLTTLALKTKNPNAQKLLKQYFTLMDIHQQKHTIQEQSTKTENTKLNTTTAPFYELRHLTR